jgi:hypothetical protein
VISIASQAAVAAAAATRTVDVVAVNEKQHIFEQVSQEAAAPPLLAHIHSPLKIEDEEAQPAPEGSVV